MSLAYGSAHNKAAQPGPTFDGQRSPLSVQVPRIRRGSGTSTTSAITPIRRVPSPSGQAGDRVVGLGLLDSSAVDTEDDGGPLWTARSPTEESQGQMTSPASPNVFSPKLLFAPEAGTSSSVVTLVATDAALRSPRSSALLDPGMAGYTGRRSSLSHASHSSSGSASSFHSVLSIRADEPASTATSRNPSSNYWLPSPSEKSSPEEKCVGLPRVEKRPRQGTPLRSLASGLLSGLLSIASTGTSDANGQPKRSLLSRALTLAYVLFSLLYLSSQLLSSFTPFAPPLGILTHAHDMPPIKSAAPPLLGTRSLHEEFSPLSAWHHPYRFSKMHSKLQSDTHENILPYVLRATVSEGKGDVTACVYTNEAWLSELPEFARRWNGPISAVFETLHERGSPGFEAAVASLTALRDREPLVKQYIDFHVVVSAPSSDAQARRIRTRLINEPIASNNQLNTARFFSRTAAVWLVGDARVFPSPGLRKRLNNERILTRVTRHADAVVVPLFAALRRDSDRARLTSPALRLLDGQSIAAGDNFASLAKRTVEAHRTSLPLSHDRWPKKKSALVSLTAAHTQPSGDDISMAGPLFALFDRSWDADKGPSNFPLWRRPAGDPRLLEGPELGGGQGLGINGEDGGGDELFRVTDYDLHYEPAVVIGRNQQPWCTERFGATRAACIYQMYLGGAEMWVVPDEWAFTVEPVERNGTSAHGLDKAVADAERLQDSIASRLYTKFHQEACMHYGREFLSLNQWESYRANHLRATCARVLSSWGVGVSDL